MYIWCGLVSNCVVVEQLWCRYKIWTSRHCVLLTCRFLQRVLQDTLYHWLPEFHVLQSTTAVNTCDLLLPTGLYSLSVSVLLIDLYSLSVSILLCLYYYWLISIVCLWFWTICLRRSFVGLCHKQLFTDAWSYHWFSGYCLLRLHGCRVTCDKLRRSSKWWPGVTSDWSHIRR